MKKLLVIATITLSMLAGMAALKAAYQAGVEHALKNAEYWILDDEPFGNADLRLNILLDENWYHEELYIG